MRRRLHFFQTRLRHIFFGPPYQKADPEAMTPHGTPQGIRRILWLTGAVWLALVLTDGVGRFFKNPPKSF